MMRAFIFQADIDGINYQICGWFQLSLVASGVYPNGKTIEGAER
jgi:hypothetical protein